MQGKSRLLSALLVGTASAVSYAALVYFAQHKIIYMPRSYDSMQRYYDHRREQLKWTQLQFSTSQGAQVAHFLGPRSLDGEKVETKFVWVLFNGNAGLGLDWADFVAMYLDDLHRRERESQLGIDESGTRRSQKRGIKIQEQLTAGSSPLPVVERLCNTAFLLIDYPGYGHCQGSASPASILESTQSAISAMEQSLKLGDQRPRYNVLGHSLGCAAALQWVNAVTPPRNSEPAADVGRVVLLAPFTNLADVGRHLVGFIPLINLLLRHNYDNERELRSFLSKRQQPDDSKRNDAKPAPRIAILHGALDSIVPVHMGRQLYKQSTPDLVIRYEEFARADHNNIIEVASDRILAAMSF